MSAILYFFVAKNHGRGDQELSWYVLMSSICVRRRAWYINRYRRICVRSKSFERMRRCCMQSYSSSGLLQHETRLVKFSRNCMAWVTATMNLDCHQTIFSNLSGCMTPSLSCGIDIACSEDCDLGSA